MCKTEGCLQNVFTLYGHYTETVHFGRQPMMAGNP